MRSVINKTTFFSLNATEVNDNGFRIQKYKNVLFLPLFVNTHSRNWHNNYKMGTEISFI